MFHLDETLKVYLHREPIDFRLNINGLTLLVDKALGLDSFAPCPYVISNRRRNRVKILGWDRSGFWLLLKRLEQDRFIWPAADVVPTLTVEQLHWLLEGIDIGVVQQHPQRLYERVAQDATTVWVGCARSALLRPDARIGAPSAGAMKRMRADDSHAHPR